MIPPGCPTSSGPEPAPPPFVLERVKAARLGRAAFGDLFVLDEIFWLTLPHQSVILTEVDDSNWFFGRTLTSKTFMVQTELSRLRAPGMAEAEPSVPRPANSAYPNIPREKAPAR